jgi:transcriptional regulator with XRE-family HTH domain
VPDPVNDAFAASLTRLRTEQGLTKGALAERAGIDQTGIGKIEAGIGGTTLRTAWLIAGALGTTVAEMLAPSQTGAK